MKPHWCNSNAQDWFLYDEQNNFLACINKQSKIITFKTITPTTQTVVMVTEKLKELGSKYFADIK